MLAHHPHAMVPQGPPTSTSSWRHVCSTHRCRRATSGAVLAAAAASSVYTVTLVLPGGTVATIRAGQSKSLLDIASYAGLHLPASCKQGTCSACCAKVVAGRVHQAGARCIPPALQKQGYVALCCATPASDVKLLTHQGVVVRKWKAEHNS